MRSELPYCDSSKALLLTNEAGNHTESREFQFAGRIVFLQQDLSFDKVALDELLLWLDVGMSTLPLSPLL